MSREVSTTLLLALSSAHQGASASEGEVIKTNSYTISDSGCGSDGAACRVFDGIGGLSGGGATSLLLPHFPAAQRETVLDYLFKPNFGASLQVLKVEIGGDAQSTDGCEPSHMHTPFDEDYNRGYEWFVMKEAKKRNPKIKLWGLSWSWPKWIACNTSNFPASCDMNQNTPYTHIDQAIGYIVKWVEGAKRVHNLTIDYVGDWNERPPNNDYLKGLRKALDAAGLQATEIASYDNFRDGELTEFYKQLETDAELSAAVKAVGIHYPGTYTDSQGFTGTQKIWASEDDSTYNGLSGAGCFGRILNQNFVHGNMTSTIHWNLVAAYEKGTRWYRASIMNALQPWGGGTYGIWRADGKWSAGAKVWMAAHTTQFTEPDTFRYLLVGSDGGAGELSNGGSYVTFKNFDTKDFSVVIEKMTHDRSHCVRPGLPRYNTTAETVVLKLDGSVLPADGSSVTLYVWRTHLASHSTDVTTEFEQQAPIKVSRSQPTVQLTSVEPNDVWTVTTLSTGHKGTPPKESEPATASLFPAEKYTDDFEDCPMSSEAKYFSDQVGAWECMKASAAEGGAAHGTVMKQLVPVAPISWGQALVPYSLIGHRDLTDLTIELDVYFPKSTDSAVVGARMQGNGAPSGAFFALSGTGEWYTFDAVGDAHNHSKRTHQGKLSSALADGAWHRVSMSIHGTAVSVNLDGKQAASYTYEGGNGGGFGLIGNVDFGEGTLIDNFALDSMYHQCTSKPEDIAVGTKLTVMECGTEVGPATYPMRQWLFAATTSTPWGGDGSKYDPSVFQLESDPKLCLQSSSTKGVDGFYRLELAACDPTKDTQLFTWYFNGVSDDTERYSYFVHKSTNYYLNMIEGADIGSDLVLMPRGGKDADYKMFYDVETHELASAKGVACVGVC